jgi:hypothetical protein
MKFSHLVEHVSKKPIPPHAKHLIVEIMVADESDEDVEVCFFCSDGRHHVSLHLVLQVPFIVVRI